MAMKQRIEIPQEVAARVLFLSDRTCCVCRIPRKAIQIHHIDDDPSNSVEANLAVLCLECHRETQIRGGFDRKLDAHQVILYRSDWYSIVDRKRHGPEGLLERQTLTQNWNWVPGLTQVHLRGIPVRLSYLQASEKDDEHRYSFEAEYPEITPSDITGAYETNLCIAAFISRTLQRFRAEAISRSSEKKEMLKKGSHPSIWDDASISFDVVLFSDDLLTVDFQLVSYMALAAHPDSSTKTMNFLLRPWTTPLELQDLFLYNSGYLDSVSRYCVDELHRQLPSDLKQGGQKDSWILRGAAARLQNFEKFLITKEGLRMVFDPYQVSCYAEGRREVFIPGDAIKALLKEPFLTIIG